MTQKQSCGNLVDIMIFFVLFFCCCFFFFFFTEIDISLTLNSDESSKALSFEVHIEWMTSENDNSSCPDESANIQQFTLDLFWFVLASLAIQSVILCNTIQRLRFPLLTPQTKNWFHWWFFSQMFDLHVKWPLIKVSSAWNHSYLINMFHQKIPIIYQGA